MPGGGRVVALQVTVVSCRGCGRSMKKQEKGRSEKEKRKREEDDGVVHTAAAPCFGVGWKKTKK
jgi:hypothetical protein